MCDQNQDAVEKALALFWESGVAQTSYGALVAQTGLSRKALYARWPDKTALVKATMELYRSRMEKRVAESLSPPSLAALDRFWQVMEASMQQPGWSGCYLFRMAAGEGRHDPEVQAMFASYTGALRHDLERAMFAAMQAGELTKDHDPEAVSITVVALLGMASVLGGQCGFGPDVAALIKLGRASCGLKSGGAKC